MTAITVRMTIMMMTMEIMAKAAMIMMHQFQPLTMRKWPFLTNKDVYALSISQSECVNSRCLRKTPLILSNGSDFNFGIEVNEVECYHF